jgi:hypothetical protein
MSSKSIYDFKNGDIITRIEPVEYKEDSIFGKLKDPMYVGTKFIFLGIANGCLYLQRGDIDKTSIFASIFGLVLKLDIYTWEKGWDFYKEPVFLKDLSINKNRIDEDEIPLSVNDDELKSIFLEESEKEIQKSIDKAIKKEDYTKAAYFKKKLDELNKHKNNK